MPDILVILRHITILPTNSFFHIVMVKSLPAYIQMVVYFGADVRVLIEWIFCECCYEPISHSPP
jgi:hypothetical protein